MVFVGIAALAILMQAFILLVLLLAVRKTARTVESAAADLRDVLVPVVPLVKTARATLERIAPQIEVAVGNLTAISSELREQTSDVHATATELIERLRVQASRADLMLSAMLDAIEKTAGFARNAISLPARQLGAIASALRAIDDSLRGATPREPEMHAAKDNDLFI
jgi:methyl-accepting chemotaxis protein